MEGSLTCEHIHLHMHAALGNDFVPHPQIVPLINFFFCSPAENHPAIGAFGPWFP
jgi:hypothetical protein